MKTTSLPLVLSIIFASSVISGSLVFFGMQVQSPIQDASIDTSSLADEIDKGIERYVQKQSEDQKNAQQADASARTAKAQSVTPPNENDYIRGNQDAEITLIEYSDYECPFCKRFHPTAISLLEQYDGKVNWVYRHFPLNFHDPLATKEALAAECAGEQGGSDAFWKYTDKIFEITTSNGRGMTDDQLFGIAQAVGLNQTELETCVKEERFLTKVRNQNQDGIKAGVTGTPGNILYNNKTGETIAVDGAQPLSQLSNAVDQLLETN